MLFFGLLTFIVLIFIQPQEFLPSMKGMPLVAIVMGIVSVSWFLSVLINKRYRLIDSPQSKFMFFLWIAIVISTFSVNWLTYTLDRLTEWGKVVLIFVLMVNIVDSLGKFRKIIFTITLCGIAIAVMGIMQYYGNDITGLGTQLGDRIRGVGIFDTNQLAYALVFCVPLVFCVFITNKSVLSSIFFILTLAVYAYCIYLTQSRGGEICLVFTLLLVLLIFSKNKFAKVISLAISGLVLLFLVYHSLRLATILQFNEDASAMNRIYVWGESLSSLKEHFLFGIGEGQFPDYFHMGAHSSFIQVVSELGLIGLYFWLALFYFSIRNLRYIFICSDAGKQKIIKVFAKGLLISIYAYLMGSLFSASAYYITLFIIFSLVVALQYLSEGEILRRCNLIRFKDYFVIVIIEFCVIISLHVWVKMVS